MGSARRTSTRLAKLERPRTDGLYLRERLFALLDERGRDCAARTVDVRCSRGRRDDGATVTRPRLLPVI